MIALLCAGVGLGLGLWLRRRHARRQRAAAAFARLPAAVLDRVAAFGGRRVARALHLVGADQRRRLGLPPMPLPLPLAARHRLWCACRAPAADGAARLRSGATEVSSCGCIHAAACDQWAVREVRARPLAGDARGARAPHAIALVETLEALIWAGPSMRAGEYFVLRVVRDRAGARARPTVRLLRCDAGVVGAALQPQLARRAAGRLAAAAEALQPAFERRAAFEPREYAAALARAVPSVAVVTLWDLVTWWALPPPP
jgi:hypothetical protein